MNRHSSDEQCGLRPATLRWQPICYSNGSSGDSNCCDLPLNGEAPRIPSIVLLPSHLDHAEPIIIATIIAYTRKLALHEAFRAAIIHPSRSCYDLLPVRQVDEMDVPAIHT